MTLAVIMKLLHILSAFAFVTGIVGRDFTFARAARAGSFEAVAALFQASEFFDRLVISSSFVVLLLGIATALMEGWPLFGFLQGANTNWVLVSLVLFIVPSAAIGPLLLRRVRQRREAARDSLAQGRITPEFSAALHDPFIYRFRAVELIVVAVIIFLMVTKPF